MALSVPPPPPPMPNSNPVFNGNWRIKSESQNTGIAQSSIEIPERQSVASLREQLANKLEVKAPNGTKAIVHSARERQQRSCVTPVSFDRIPKSLDFGRLNSTGDTTAQLNGNSPLHMSQNGRISVQGSRIPVADSAPSSEYVKPIVHEPAQRHLSCITPLPFSKSLLHQSATSQELSPVIYTPASEQSFTSDYHSNYEGTPLHETSNNGIFHLGHTESNYAKSSLSNEHELSMNESNLGNSKEAHTDSAIDLTMPSPLSTKQASLNGDQPEKLSNECAKVDDYSDIASPSSVLSIGSSSTHPHPQPEMPAFSTPYYRESERSTKQQREESSSKVTSADERQSKTSPASRRSDQQLNDGLFSSSAREDVAVPSLSTSQYALDSKLMQYSDDNTSNQNKQFETSTLMNHTSPQRQYHQKQYHQVPSAKDVNQLSEQLKQSSSDNSYWYKKMFQRMHKIESQQDQSILKYRTARDLTSPVPSHHTSRAWTPTATLESRFDYECLPPRRCKSVGRYVDSGHRDSPSEDTEKDIVERWRRERAQLSARTTQAESTAARSPSLHLISSSLATQQHQSNSPSRPASRAANASSHTNGVSSCGASPTCTTATNHNRPNDSNSNPTNNNNKPNQFAFQRSRVTHFHLPSYRFQNQDQRPIPSLTSNCWRCGRLKRQLSWREIEFLYGCLGKKGIHQESFNENLNGRIKNAHIGDRLEDACKQFDYLLESLDVRRRRSSYSAAQSYGRKQSLSPPCKHHQSQSDALPLTIAPKQLFRDFSLSILTDCKPSTSKVTELSSITRFRYVQSQIVLVAKTIDSICFAENGSLGRDLYELKKSAKEELLNRQRVEKLSEELEEQRNRRHGYVPSASPALQKNFDRFDGLLSEFGQSDHRRATTPSFATTPHQVIATCTALYSFKAQSARELSFNRGDVIRVHRVVDANWLEGERNGQVGILPSSYVQMDEGVATERMKMIALYPFFGRNRNELSLKKGEVVEYRRTIDANWMEGVNCHGEIGIFPKTYVQEFSESDLRIAPTSNVDECIPDRPKTPKIITSSHSDAVRIHFNTEISRVDDCDMNHAFFTTLSLYQCGKTESSFATRCHYHPLRASWKSVRDEIRRSPAIAISIDRAALLSAELQTTPSCSESLLNRAMNVALQKYIYVIIVRFIDHTLTMRSPPNQYKLTILYRKFGRQLAAALRAIPFDQNECWNILENRLLYNLIASRCSVRTLLAWHAFIDEISTVVLQGFCQAVISDLPNPLPTIFEETPMQCFHFEPAAQQANIFTRIFAKLELLDLCACLSAFADDMCCSRDESQLPTRKMNHGNEVQAWQQKHTKEGLSGAAHIVPRNAETYRALYAYKPRNVDELELCENDIVFVVEKCDDGTLLRTGQFGTFPGNYVEKH
ncbi:unnamed protein product [Anisakis simplex]|uniref:ASD2 domain-containing protein n=1 Tax=Anisakis simplex TaxID=6269 RepID=A0A158PNN4_ANISI|nr:unnamed protein product [Anisakis simplex]